MVPLIFQREELPELDGFLCKISDSYGKNLGNDERSPKRLSGLFVNVVNRRLASSKVLPKYTQVYKQTISES